MLNVMELNEVLKANGFDEYNAEELAYQLTAYERGYIDYEDGIIDLLVKPFLADMAINELVSYFNDYCYDNSDFDSQIYEFDEEFFNEYFSSPLEASRATYFGEISSWADEYITFNGYGNLKSMSQWVARDEILDDVDFVTWAFDNFDEFEGLHDEEFKNSIIAMTMNLVRQGY